MILTNSIVQIWIGDTCPDFIVEMIKYNQSVCNNYVIITDLVRSDLGNIISLESEVNKVINRWEFLRPIWDNLSINNKSNFIRFSYLLDNIGTLYLDTDAKLVKPLALTSEDKTCFGQWSRLMKDIHIIWSGYDIKNVVDTLINESFKNLSEIPDRGLFWQTVNTHLRKSSGTILKDYFEHTHMMGRKLWLPM